MTEQIIAPEYFVENKDCGSICCKTTTFCGRKTKEKKMKKMLKKVLTYKKRCGILRKLSGRYDRETQRTLII